MTQIVVDFTASWCGPCRFIAPFLDELALKFPSVTFLKVDIDDLEVLYYKLQFMKLFSLGVAFVKNKMYSLGAVGS